MKIRDKLLLGFGLYILFAATIGYFAYRELRAIKTRLSFLETADDVSITMLEVRRHEKNFLLYKTRESLPELRKYIAILKQDVEGIKAEISAEIGVEDYDSMKKTITGYETMVEKVVHDYESQESQVELVRAAGRSVEGRLSGDKLETFLVLRRYEKNLMLYKDAHSYETFLRTYAALGMGGDAKVKRYNLLVKELYGLYNKEFEDVERMRSEAREVQSFTLKLSKKERADIAATLGTSMKLLLYSLLAMIVLGSAVNMMLSTSIVRPLRKLEKITKKVAMGDFSESIEVRGKDEVASLGESFNQMEEKLKNALNDLEHTINMLIEKQGQLVEARKLASIGLLSAGIAHEINNPLTSVLTFSHLMLEQTPPDDPNREKLEMMVKETERARNIMRQLLSFAREAPISPTRINVNKPVTEVVESLAAQEKFKDIELSLNLAHDVPDINADPEQVGQVVLNLLLNAVNAITPPGRIGVSTRASEGHVEVEVSDTGCGIPAEDLRRVFDPFFTTWGPGKGTGLGLAVSYGIIKKHQGDIEVKSELGKGSTFTVRLPVNG